MGELTAQQKLVAAELAREDFYFYSRYTFLRKKGFQWMRAKHHAPLCAALDRVYRGECKRLVINLPPRYSKTELAVVNWMSWCLGKVPDSEFIHISYAAPLALNNSANTRELVQHEVYGEIFPEVELRKDSSAKGDWRTTKGGVVYATGAEGTVTGFGAGKARPGFGGAIIIDDPHKPGEADSDTVRQGVLDWFNNTLQSRVNSADTPIIVIMQRLHERDLAGWLLGRKPGEEPRPGGNGEVWEHVCFEALSEDGEALWPEKHTAADLNRMTNVVAYENTGDYTDMSRRPPHSVHVIAEGGLDVEIAQAIYDAKAAGIDTHGAFAVPVSGCRRPPAWPWSSAPTKRTSRSNSTAPTTCSCWSATTERCFLAMTAINSSERGKPWQRKSSASIRPLVRSGAAHNLRLLRPGATRRRRRLCWEFSWMVRSTLPVFLQMWKRLRRVKLAGQSENRRGRD